MIYADSENLISEARNVGGITKHWVEIKESRQRLVSPIVHAVEHAKAIAQEAESNNLPIKLFLSGGIDSEAMAEAFILAKVSFEVVIGRYNNDMNHFDYKDAVAFCEKNNLQYQFIDVDVFEFLESGSALKYAHEFGCRSPQLAVHLHLMDQVSGYCVLAGNPIYPILKNSNEKLTQELENGKLEIEGAFGIPDQNHSVYFRFLKKRRRLGQPFFFQSSPDLCWSFLNINEIAEHLANDVKVLDYKMKCQCFQLGGFQVKPRKKKYTGFEKYRIEYDKRMNTQWGQGFDLRFRAPLEEINPQMPLEMSFVLPKQVTGKILSILLRKKEILARSENSSNFSTSISDRRQLLWQASALAGGILISLLYPNAAKAASCGCCMGGFPAYPNGLKSEAACVASCMKLGFDGYEVGGGGCFDF